MLYVKLQNIIPEEEAIKDPQRLFNDVENHEDAWVIIRNGKPSFIIASAKLIQNEESGNGLGGFEVGVQPSSTVNQASNKNTLDEITLNDASLKGVTPSETVLNEIEPSINEPEKIGVDDSSDTQNNNPPITPEAKTSIQNNNHPEEANTFYNPFTEPSNNYSSSNYAPDFNGNSLNTINPETNSDQSTLEQNAYSYNAPQNTTPSAPTSPSMNNLSQENPNSTPNNLP